ncbi:flagellar basal body P-ring formation chaperone FlgA [Acidocella sp.]|uniref:flagellar basal body P-ring formation chaperone FlgA n=1 Tax=Acidocella sp. TaxID=50710 RepID=UPI00262FAC48|nr:flagellar basal body P-ring formation chaperone FlgA [Acidocella sp.]MDD2795464.1 flagellar basal body P-ring formation chaperone FlgA [Acidocella sp.]
MRRLPAILGALLLAPPAVAAPQSQQAVAQAIIQAAQAIAPPGASLTLGPVAGAQYMQACTLPLSISISGTAPYEQAAAHCPSPAWTLYVTVTVAQTEHVVIAARPIAAGQTLSQGDITLAREPVSLYAGRQVYYDPAQLLGATAIMSVSAGGILNPADIAEPVMVKSGQTVAVEVISGGVTLSLNAVATETGRIGDTILFTNPSSGRRFSAQITATGPVLNLQP